MKPAWAGLPTESRNPRSRRLDEMPTARVVALLIDEDRRAVAAAARHAPAITRAAILAAKALESGRRIHFVGAGTSGRLGILEAAECPPTFGSDPDRIRGVMAGGEGAVFRAVEGAEDREDEGRREGSGVEAGDLLIGISASSVTPFVRGALSAAREKGAHTVLVTCAPGRGLRALADVVIAIATGPEVLTGSTRLKAGSATKAVLNAITTAAMVRLGKAFENLMVDMRPDQRQAAGPRPPHRRRRGRRGASGSGAPAGGRGRRGQDRDRDGAHRRTLRTTRAPVSRARAGTCARRWRGRAETSPGLAEPPALQPCAGPACLKLKRQGSVS